MNENILLISENSDDRALLEKQLDPDQFKITQSAMDQNIDEKILGNGFPMILADYNLIKDKAEIFYDLMKERSKACLIFYGDNLKAEEVNQILQKGVYSIIPRPLLSERIYDVVIGGLENRKAFIEILKMMDELKNVNKNLEREKDALRKKNQELIFINLLSHEITFDFNWSKILQRMINVGLKDTLSYSLFGILFRIGSRWNFSIDLDRGLEPRDEELLKSEILSSVSSSIGKKIPEEEVNFQIISPETQDNRLSYHLEKLMILPLTLAGDNLGAIFFIPENDSHDDNAERLISTITNLLPLSLKTAQEYYKLREAAVTDSLTGIYNRKGLYDFLKKEYHRAKRYHKSLAFVMIDMDNFKSINDSMGHQAGDYILRELASILKKSIRKPDIVARYGGDEFAILFPEATLNEAETIMSRVGTTMENHTFQWGSGRVKTSMSYGISHMDELTEEATEEDLVKLADSRLYHAKNTH
jgi:diguanylate cyclase (GGDEF)-like protein